MNEPKYIGKQTSNAVDALEKVMGKAHFVGDLVFPGMLHAKLLLSPIPHGAILRLETSPAQEVQGVQVVITCEDFQEGGSFGWPVKDAFILANQKVRYQGDPIAVVAADTPEAAAAGVEAIELELEELPVVADPGAALDADAPVIPLKPPLGEGNLCERHIVRNGDPEKVLKKASQTLKRAYQFAHQEHACIETEGVVAIPEPDGSLTIYANNQSPHINRDNTAAVLGMDPDDVRIIQPPVGGSFGGKDDIVYQLSAQAGKLAQITGKPIRLILSREESMQMSYKRESGLIELEIGVDGDGALLAGKGTCLADSGAYASMTTLSAWRATMHLLGTYRYQAATVDTDVVYTNNGYSGAFRGFGNTKATAASEMLMDEMAVQLGEDPVAFRLKNCLKPGDAAFTGNVLQHQFGLTRCIEWVRDRSDWEKTRQAFTENQGTEGIHRGLGFACYFHGSGLGGEGLDYARATLNIERDHTVTLQSGLTDYGQGSRTVFTLIAAEILGVDPGRIIMLRPDTQTALESGPTVASRASIVGGNATRVAAEKINQTLLLAASELMGCSPAQIHREESYYIGPSEDPVSFDQVVDHAFELGLQLFERGYWQIPEIHWDFQSGTGIPYFTYSFGAQAAQVAVEQETGNVRVEKIWAAHDGGKILFPKGARGQMLGGITQGIGFALTEGFDYQEGIPQKLRFSQYTIPTTQDVPEFETTYIETVLPEGPFGAKNLAEPVMVATAPAIANAVYHATGVRAYHLPIRAEWLKAQLAKL